MAVIPEMLKREAKVPAEQSPSGTSQKEAPAGDVLDDDGVGADTRRKAKATSKPNKMISPRS